MTHEKELRMNTNTNGSRWAHVTACGVDNVLSPNSVEGSLRMQITDHTMLNPTHKYIYIGRKTSEIRALNQYNSFASILCTNHDVKITGQWLDNLVELVHRPRPAVGKKDRSGTWVGTASVDKV